MNGKDTTLAAIEQKLNDKIANIMDLKISVCIHLAEIKRSGFYFQAGAVSFRDYLHMRRINLNSTTAYEYAAIGEVLIDYEDDLKTAGWIKEQGLKKLMLIPQALRNHSREQVFASLIEYGYRDFKKYAVSARAEINKMTETTGDPCMNKPNSESSYQSGVFEDGGKIYIDYKVEGKQLLSFNEFYLNEINTFESYRNFMRYITGAAQDFFRELRRKEAQSAQRQEQKRAKCLTVSAKK